MLVFLIPLMLSNAMQSVGQLAGSIIVGRALGVDALAAISAFFPLFFLLVSFSIGIGSGSSILIGQAYGAQNEKRVKEIIGTTLTFTFLVGIVLAVLGSIFAPDILRIMGTPANIIDVTVHYARILFVAIPVLFLYFVYTTFMRGTGDSKTPFYFLVVSTVLNIIFLPILIFGWIGVPKFGVYGAAYATVFSTVLTFIIMIIYLRKKNHPLKFDSSISLKMDGTLLKLLMRLGIPASINMILVSLSEIAVITFVNGFGSDATAAYGAVNQVASYVQMPAISLGIAVSIFAAQSIGANKFERLKEVIRSGIMLNYVIGSVLILLIYLFSNQILALFLTSQYTLRIAEELLVITLWSYLIFGHAQIITATMRASGTVLWPTVFSIMAIWCVEVPVAYVLSQFTPLEIKGIWIGYPAAFVVSLILQYSYYQFVWKKKKIERLVG
ncbi:MATE family efflux transporter [Priestia megaterium]|uniref:MATE family efflux transporter n=1 Tax=Priestia megaterium TaxID=1404 RepID=UPI003F7EB11C